MKNIFILFACFIVPALSFATPPVQDLRGDAAQQALSQYETELARSPSSTALKSAGIILHQLNRLEPNEKQVLKAEKYLKQALSITPADAELLAWLGSITTMKAMFVDNPGKKTFFVKLGTRMMDKAIKKAPQNTIVRLTRAYNSLELPAFLMRTKFAVQDFKHYLKQCESIECPSEYIADAKLKLATAEKIISDNF